MTPNSGYRIDSVKVDHGYTSVALSADEGVYGFTACAINKVIVTFADESAVATSIEITTETFPGLSRYSNYDGTVNVNGVDVTVHGNQIADYGDGLQFRNSNKNPSLIYSTVVIPETITSIEMTFTAGKSLPKTGHFGIATGETEVTSVTDIGNYQQTMTYTPTATNHSYFAIGHTGAATGSFYIESIVVNFTPAA